MSEPTSSDAGSPRPFSITCRLLSEIDVASTLLTFHTRWDDSIASAATTLTPSAFEEAATLEAPAGAMCSLDVRSAVPAGCVCEIEIEVAHGSDPTMVIERSVGYSTTGELSSRQFPLPNESVVVQVSVTARQLDEVGTPLKVMVYNGWNGGVLDHRADPNLAVENIAQLTEFLRSELPDVLFVGETYGLGPSIQFALGPTLTRREYRGIQLTRQPDQAPLGDNLWLFTHLPVDEVYPRISDAAPTLSVAPWTGPDLVTSFNIGGVRLGLPDGSSLNAFAIWLYYLADSSAPTTRAAIQRTLIGGASMDAEAIVATDLTYRADQADAVLQYIDSLVPDPSAAVLIGGDFNAMSHLDWSASFASAPRHAGLVLPWPVMKKFDDAGYVDCYRLANPDAGRYPGETRLSPVQQFTPSRIDYVMARGERVRVLASSTRRSRLPHHRGGDLERRFPFYSDHASVVADILITGHGAYVTPDGQDLRERPEPPTRVVVDSPSGRQVPPDSIAVTASGPPSEPEKIINGGLDSLWTVDGDIDPSTGEPHGVTLDLGQIRDVCCVRYQPPISGRRGTILRYSLWLSCDDVTYFPIASGAWEADQLPRNVDFSATPARYVRLLSHASVGRQVSIGNIAVYEMPTA